MQKLQDTIIAALTELLNNRGDTGIQITPATEVFGHLGLDSYAFAELVLILETQTGLEPFSKAAHVIPIRTVGDLISVYSEEAERKAESGSANV